MTTSALKKRLANYLKKKKSPSLNQFCADAGVDASSVSRFLNGKRDGFHMRTYEKLVAALEKVS